MKGRQRRKWLGLAALHYHGYLCDACTYQRIERAEEWTDAWCDHPSEAVSKNSLMESLCDGDLQFAYLTDCRGFESGKTWKEIPDRLSEKDAEMAYREALREHLAEMRAAEATEQAEWKKGK